MTKTTHRRSAIINQIHPFRKKQSGVFTFNPASQDQQRDEPVHADLTLSQYDKASIDSVSYEDIQKLLAVITKEKVNWIQVEGLRTGDVKAICDYSGYNQLTVEDILSTGQRAKMDELSGGIFCLLPVINYNKDTDEIELRQVSLILTDHTVFSFDSAANNNFYTRARANLQIENSKLRNRNADFLFYYLLDTIVDNYFNVIESLGIQIEDMEEQIIRYPNSNTLLRLNNFRQKTGVLRRAIMPVRDLVANILKTEDPSIDSRTLQYIKDVYDHIVQANEITDSYRDLMMNLQGLYINQVSLKMNEIMKVLTILAALFAPLTLITGIFGMNFDNMPELHARNGYFITLGVMVLIFVVMLVIIKKRKWF